MLEFSFIVSAFIAGVITFLAPCTLPLVPAYVGFISGVDSKTLVDPSKKKLVRSKMLQNGSMFVLGFSIIFILFGVLAGTASGLVATFRVPLTRIGGVLVILFGLLMMGVFNISFLKREHKIKMPSWISVGKPSSSFLIGGLFGLGWTPCVGPVLGAILVLAGTAGGAAQGALLLAVFSLGLAIPFIITALAFSWASSVIGKAGKWLDIISRIGGVFLILLGLLLVSNNFIALIEWGFRLLESVGYEEITNLL